MEFRLGFPMARDSATFQDKETEVPLLSRGKKTMGQAQNLANIQDRSRTRLSLSLCQNPGWDAGWDRTIHTIFLQ